MSGERPIFIKVADGIQVAANVKPPAHIDREIKEGQPWPNVFEQPPFNWVDLEENLVPENHRFFKTLDDNEQAISLRNALILAAVEKEGMLGLIVEEAQNKAPQSDRQKYAQLKRLRVGLEKHLKPFLVDDLALVDEQDLVASEANLRELASIILKVQNFLREYPFALKYIREMVLNADANFEKSGKIKSSRTRGTFTISSYAAYAATKASLAGELGWVAGLGDELPSVAGMGVQLESTRPEKGQLQIVRRRLEGLS